jgi:hypothetical protein
MENAMKPTVKLISECLILGLYVGIVIVALVAVGAIAGLAGFAIGRTSGADHAASAPERAAPTTNRAVRAADGSGLHANDEIIAVNGIPFDRIDDLLAVINQLNLADEIRLSLRRDGKAVEIKLRAGLDPFLSGVNARPLGDDQYELTFKYRPGKPAKSIFLAGSFNKWSTTAHRMDGPDQEGRFTTQLRLPKGKYEYKYVVDDQTSERDRDGKAQTEHGRVRVLPVGR